MAEIIKIYAKSINRENNEAVYNFLKELERGGVISGAALEVIFESFAGMALPVISEKEVEKIAEELIGDFSHRAVRWQIVKSGNAALFKSFFKLDVLCSLSSAVLKKEKEIIKKVHSAILKKMMAQNKNRS
ncbi:hypothetical protein HY798_01525 [Candidatus Falkowbacteria bacterium]|nr:hypothetical protein [Candidatus Falkowbacteria bacterium]